MMENIGDSDGSDLPLTENCSLLLFINEEERCCGLFDHISSDEVEESYIFNKSPNSIQNLKRAKNRIGGEIIDVANCDVIDLVSEVMSKVKDPSEIIIDISVLSKPELLILMQALDRQGLLIDTRLIYSQPEDYHSSRPVTDSKGIQNIDSVPGFINSTPLNRKTLLILMLGFEPARSKAIYNNYDPDSSYLIVPSPGYKEGWEERTVRQNSYLRNVLGENNIEHIHALHPGQFVKQFNRFLTENEIKLGEWNTFVSPLSTKPQTVGLYYIWRKNERTISVVHSTPLERNKLFVPTGLSETWELVGYKDEI